MLRRLSAGFSLTAVIVILNLVATVISLPLFLRAWGDRVYGEWLALTNLTASLSLLNFGVQTYVTNLLIGHFQRGEITDGTRVFSAGLRLYLVFFAVLVGITLVIAPDAPSRLGVSHISVEDSSFIVWVQGGLMACAILQGYILSILIAINRYPHRLRYSLGEILVRSFLPLGVALFSGSPRTAALSMALGGLILFLVGTADTARLSPFQIGIKDVKWADSIRLLGPSIVFFAVSLAWTMLTSGVILFLSAGAGGAAVTLFAATLTLSNLARAIIGQFLNTFYPEIGTAASGGGDPERLRRWFAFCLKLVSLVGWAVSVGIAAWGGEVITFWTGGELVPDLRLNTLLALYLAVQSPALVTRTFGFALNQQGGLLRVELITALITALGCILFIPAMGARGASMALLLGGVINVPLSLRLNALWVGMPIRHLTTLMLVEGAAPAVLTFVVCILSPLIPPGPRLLLSSGVLIMGAWMGLHWLTPSERLVLTNVLQALQRRLRGPQA